MLLQPNTKPNTVHCSTGNTLDHSTEENPLEQNCEKVKSLPLLTVVQDGRRTGLPYLNGWVRIPPPLWRGPITF